MGRAGLLVCHPCEEDGKFDVIGVFNVPHEKPLRLCLIIFCDKLQTNEMVCMLLLKMLSARLEYWSAIHFNLVLESAQRVADRLLNGSGLI